MQDREAQRAFDKQRVAAQRAEEARQYVALREELKGKIEKHLRETQVLTLKEDCPPVGLCSPSRARWLGMAASVAGGAVYVNATVSSLDIGYLSVGTLPSGEAVPNRVMKPLPILNAIRKDLERLANNSCLPSIWESAEVVMQMHSHLVSLLRAS